MRNLEYKHPGSAAGRAFDAVCNALTLPPQFVLPLLSLQWVFGSRPRWSWRNLTRAKLHVGVDDGSQYLNAGLYFALSFPFGVWLHIRANENHIFQTSVVPNLVLPVLFMLHGLNMWPLALLFFVLPGWKRIGRPAYHFRHQTDESAQGGLAIGWEAGPK